MKWKLGLAYISCSVLVSEGLYPACFGNFSPLEQVFKLINHSFIQISHVKADNHLKPAVVALEDQDHLEHLICLSLSFQK